jgi:hypothetical protein
MYHLCMANAVPDSGFTIPPFASVQTREGVTELRVRAVFSKSFKFFFGLMLAVFVALSLLFLKLIEILSAAATASQSWLIGGGIICGLALWMLALLGLCCLFLALKPAQAIFDGIKLRLKDMGATYEIPIEQIHAIRLVKYPGSRLEIDTEGRFGHIFLRGRRTALELTTPEGRIEFFHCWEEPKVAWITARVHRLVFPAIDEEPVTVARNLHDTEVAIASRAFGKSHAVLRYQIAPSRRAKALVAPFLSWSMPDDAWRNVVRSRQRSGLMMSVGLIAITSLALWACHRWVVPLCAPDLPWIRIVLIIMGLAGFQAFAFFLSPFLGMHNPPAYALNDDGVLMPSKENPRLRWNSVASFTFRRNLQLRGRHILALHLKAGYQCDLPLPQGEIETSIVAELSRRLRQSPPPTWASPRKPMDWLLGTVLTAAFIWGAGTYLGRFGHGHHGNAISWLMIGALVAGPGTWIAIMLRRRRAGEQLLGLAIALNFVAFLGLTTTFVSLGMR